MIEKKVMSQCVSVDYCKGWNDAVAEAKQDYAKEYVKGYSQGFDDGIDTSNIVRCKDCVFWGWHKRKVRYWSGEDVKLCGMYKYPIKMGASDFCSHGKKGL